jgi:hypothetical protein
MDKVENKPSNVETKTWPEVGDPVRTATIIGTDPADDNVARVYGTVVKLNTELTPARVKALRDSIVAAIDRRISAWAAGTFTVRFTDVDHIGCGEFSKPEDAEMLAKYLGRELAFTADGIVEFDTAYGEWEVS